MRRFATLTATIAVLAALSPVPAAEPKAIDLGDRRELLVDDFLIDRSRVGGMASGGCS